MLNYFFISRILVIFVLYKLEITIKMETTGTLTFHKSTEGEYREELIPSKMKKKDQHAFLRYMLEKNDKWAKQALLRIFAFQTEFEQIAEQTNENNNVGFTGADAEILSSFAKQLKDRGWLSTKQLKVLHKRMPKYSRQLLNISNKNKLNYQVKAWLKSQAA